MFIIPLTIALIFIYTTDTTECLPLFFVKIFLKKNIASDVVFNIISIGR